MPVLELSKLAQQLAPVFGELPAAIVILDKDRRAYYFHGDGVHENSLFEIGSVSKPLFALLASQLVMDKVWSLEAPLSELLGKEFEHHNYSLKQLLTHRSGLPRLPKNLIPPSIDDPYASFDTKAMKQALMMPIERKGNYVYSNFGYGVLGWQMAKELGVTQLAMMQKHVFNKLKMAHATLSLTGVIVHRLKGHNHFGKQVANWHFDSLVGAGGVLASAADMANWISAYWQREGVDIKTKSILKASLTSLSDDMVYGFSKGLNGWYFHEGKTAGFSTMVVFDPILQQGVIVLVGGECNTNNIAMSLLSQLEEKEK
ncbi:serine hydrolase domain-containing protein [Pseudoalteromonas aurantia]|uniref:Beta-lactamase n=1 Tax=Pseudoalteromonas aurantia TaxID=43654 RepID=A0A5S3V4J1_9GAMM|nr:serine hydrolase domain-containing protein [Pseudoalteromonas aurantia]TMO60838.1 hypothetical protein CWC18_13040 [Pseudoalteromonas aurantia]TMO65746.1 hypothetical protein CWC19_17215 [Pseudoalteromonas aurantia]TMO78312.1 hypothetical protein CWC20_02025 [Pseudoalteromonas aurantia]